ncbi:MAG: patatin-like phospholipase family protein [Rhodothermales bacterium]
MIKQTYQKIRELIIPSHRPKRLALVLSGGGARGAYQAGVLKYIAETFPETRFQIMTGISAGAINTGYLANHTGSFQEAAEGLLGCWVDLAHDRVIRPESTVSFIRRMMSTVDTDSNGENADFDMSGKRGLLDPSPLRDYLATKLETTDGRLTGVQENIARGRLYAFAVTATNYMTGQTTTFVNGSSVERWVRPNRIGIHTETTIDHIMASAALPLIFPAVYIGGAWYGDGGVRMTMPLSPALNMGADHVMVISTRYDRSRVEADQPSIVGYPPAAQVIGILMNAIFLDVLDQDALMLQRVNELIAHLPPRHRRGLRPINLLMLRPSLDIGKLAGEYRPHFSGAFRLMTRGLGSERTKSADWMSMVLFERGYMERLIEIGYADGGKQRDEIERFLASSLAAQAANPSA